MELFNNFKSLFLSVWERGILGVDIFQILIGRVYMIVLQLYLVLNQTSQAYLRNSFPNAEIVGLIYFFPNYLVGSVTFLK